MLHFAIGVSPLAPSVPPFYHGVARIAVSTSISGDAKDFIKSKVQVFPRFQSVKMAMKFARGNAKYMTSMKPNMPQLLEHQFPLLTIVFRKASFDKLLIIIFIF